MTKRKISKLAHTAHTVRILSTDQLAQIAGGLSLNCNTYTCNTDSCRLK